MGAREKHAWLRLIRTPQIGSVTFWELLSHFGSGETALDALPEFAKRGAKFSAHSIPSAQAIEKSSKRLMPPG